ncbi:type IVB secretion system protein IcmH/DotU [Pseudomonas sp.]|uniref:type IVB secretion system protein IcmH/DotU n=1 Tax=Pseudomonas sp. TaxID=306 RepID=UPI00263457E8|nr:type IVB secretion system protein IcmH/DotU [Pseudomonas sp.]
MSRETGHKNDQTQLAPHIGGKVGTQRVTDRKPPVIELEVQDARQTFSASINPLVAAAASLLSKLVELQHTAKIDNFDELKKEWTRELGTFQSRALNLNAESYLLNDASYVLCTVLDEAAVIAELKASPSLDPKKGWSASASSLLYQMHTETFGGEKFFILLDRLRGNPVKHLDLLELMYLCLALEFKGKYHSADKQGDAELNDIRDGLYRTIRHLRGDALRELSPHWHGLKDQRRNLVRIVPWWMVVLFTLMCLGVMYSGFSWVLSEQRETVLEPYRQLDAAVIQPPLQGRDA